MAFDIRDIAPPDPGPRLVTILGRDGAEIEVPLRPVTNEEIAHLAEDRPKFRRAYFSEGVPEEVQRVALFGITTALIAASLGKPGDRETEAAIDRLPRAEYDKLRAAVLELTVGKGAVEDAPGPLPAAGDGAAGSTASPPPSPA